MAAFASSKKNRHDDDENPELIRDEATPTCDDIVVYTEIISNTDSHPVKISALNSDTGTVMENNSLNQKKHVNQHNHEENNGLRPFTDPGLIARRRRSSHEVWLKDFVSPKSAPQSPYSALSQTLKKIVSERTACRLGCRGSNCKYERSDYWRPDQMAINGIYSHWITDNILACSRPTKRHVDLRTCFYDAGIRTIFNLEAPDEHVHCGHGNHASGYSYDPAEFMDVGIFVYNYAMEDYGIVKVETMLDIMKVMSFSMKQGKVAVHCHAGLGRTGFVICSYLVHEYRMTAHDAIHYIRGKRPGSVQMSRQIESVEEYENFLIPKRRVFTDCADDNTQLPLDVHLKNQQAFIHGRDAYIYKFIPRILFLCVARLIELCVGYKIDTMLLTLNRRVNDKPVFVRDNLQKLTEEEKAMWLDFVPSFFHDHENLSHSDFSPHKQIINCMIMSIQEDSLTSEQQTKVLEWKQKINKKNNGIDKIFDETDPCVISALLWSWLKLLKIPVIPKEDYELFTKANVQQPMSILPKLSKPQRGTIELLAKMFAYIRRYAVNNEGRLLVYCIIYALTHRPLANTNEIKELIGDNEQLHSFFVSEQPDYQDKARISTVEHLVSNACLNKELLDSLEIFFIGVANQFEQY